eukprot:TRINITY_DN3085_c0_g1_i1.p1 TRINITY_DN3085_c0_g1~~TRINITY_DN3085_c0_g1_i1.p1  ORF type:complete len:479 (-),score=127.38 TRINITY_DN3085_c0_g1_i1:200-1567(-)
MSIGLKVLISALLLLLVASSVDATDLKRDLNSTLLMSKYDTNGDQSLDIEEFEVYFFEIFPDETHDEHAHEEEVHDHDHDHAHEEEEEEIPENYCYGAELVFHLSDVNEDEVLQLAELIDASGTMMNKLTFCDEVALIDGNCTKDTGLAWLLGLISAVVISLISLVAIVLYPFYQKKKALLLNISISFAVGALISDALLHLLPEIFGIHTHSDEETAVGDDPHGHNHGEETIGDLMEEFLGPGLVICGSILTFFLVEKLVMKYTGGHSHGDMATISDGESTSKSDSDEPDVIDTPDPKAVTAGYVSLIGDAVHNFVDGLSIGVSYTASLEAGLATTIAVAFHEIPQEVGDFALLVAAGFTMRKAFLFNLASGAVAVLGTFFGLLIGSSANASHKWILSFVCGSFFYIAMGDLMPVLHTQVKQHRRNIIYQVVGILGGFLVMLLISFYELVPSDCT